MDDQLVRNDTTYISTSLAAELTEYSQDYVGQLARDGHIESVKVGHKRFVGRDDVISYALDRKSDLSREDIPEPHRPDTPSEPEEDEREGEVNQVASEKQQSDNTESEHENTEPQQAEAIVVPDSKVDESDFQQTVHESAPEETTASLTDEDIARDRANSRWQKSKERLRKHATASTPAKPKSRLPMVVAVLLALVMSFGLWVGPLSDSDQTLGRMAHNVSLASQSAYTALGYGLDQQLQKYGPVGTIGNSLQETAQLTADAFSPRTKEPNATGDENKQMAAAGSTARSFTARLNSFGRSIADGLSWITQPITFNRPRFRDYYQPSNTVVSAETVDTHSESNQVDSHYSPEDTQTDQPERGAIVVPAPNTAAAREATRQEIRSQFSDPVDITASTSNSGVIQPRFEDRRGDRYMYVMVPTRSTSSTSSTARE